MTIAEVAAEDGAEVEDEAVEVLLLPGEATAVSGSGAGEGHPHLMCPETDTRHQEPPMTETDTSHDPGRDHPPPEITDP